MAVTSIWPIKGRVDKVINYARNPEKTTEARNAKSRQSEPTSMPKDKAARGTDASPERPSVREELRSIRSEQKQKAAQTRDERGGQSKTTQQKTAQHKQPRSKKTKKTKER